MEGVLIAAEAESVEPGKEDVAVVAGHGGQGQQRKTWARRRRKSDASCRVAIHQRKRENTDAVESGLTQILERNEALRAGPEDHETDDDRAGRHGQTQEGVNQQQITRLEPVLFALQGLKRKKDINYVVCLNEKKAGRGIITAGPAFIIRWMNKG